MNNNQIVEIENDFLIDEIEHYDSKLINYEKIDNI